MNAHRRFFIRHPIVLTVIVFVSLFCATACNGLRRVGHHHSEGFTLTDCVTVCPQETARQAKVPLLFIALVPLLAALSLPFFPPHALAYPPAAAHRPYKRPLYQLYTAYLI